jgi:hypothetical protein
MGIGMTVFCSPGEAKSIIEALPEARTIGEVVKHEGQPKVVIK